MLTCTPLSLCSWNYRVVGLPAGEGMTELYMLSEQGRLSLGGAAYEVVKHGPMSGHWTLEGGGRVVAEARKPSAMYRTMVVSCGEAALTVRAASPFTRVFEVLVGESDVDGAAARDVDDAADRVSHGAADRVVGSVRPVHSFTRRAIMECDAAVPQLAQMFVFWLVAMSWRRTAKQNNG
jgi:hypothetical protein